MTCLDLAQKLLLIDTVMVRISGDVKHRVRWLKRLRGDNTPNTTKTRISVREGIERGQKRLDELHEIRAAVEHELAMYEIDTIGRLRTCDWPKWLTSKGKIIRL